MQEIYSFVLMSKKASNDLFTLGEQSVSSNQTICFKPLNTLFQVIKHFVT